MVLSTEYMLYFLPETLEVGALQTPPHQCGDHNEAGIVVCGRRGVRGPGKTLLATGTHRTREGLENSPNTL